MTDLERWMRRHAGIPVMWAVCGVLAMQAGYLCFLARREYAGELSRVDRLVETASLGIQQEDRPLVEAALMRGLGDVGASSVAFCRGGQADILYPPTAGAICMRTPGGLASWTVRRPAVGGDGGEFVFVFDRLLVFESFLVLAAIAGVLGVAVALILLRARESFEAEVLGPLRKGLNGQGRLAISELEELRRRNEEYHALRRESAVAKALFELSEQVAHDIRGPVEVLSYAIEHPESLAGNGCDAIRASAARIRDVADSLLKGPRVEAGPVPLTAPMPTTECLSALVAEVVEEERLRWKGRPGVMIDFRCESGARDALAVVEASHFRRLVSNVVDNAVQAIGEGGKVAICLTVATGRLVLSVADTGRGIAPGLLPLLGRKGATFGKSRGSGLGLYHARNCAELWGGDLRIESQLGRGTTVHLSLPATMRTAERRTTALPDAVLVDDDSLMREVWLQAAERCGKNLLAFAGVSDFMKFANRLGRGVPIYLDSRLGPGVRGETVATELRLRGFRNISMVTGRPPKASEDSGGFRTVLCKSPPWASNAMTGSAGSTA